MNTIEQLFSTRAWNRLVINIAPGTLCIALLGLVNNEVGGFYKQFYEAYSADKALIWPIGIGFFLAALIIGLLAEELGGFLEGKLYDKLVARNCDVPTNYIPKRCSGNLVSYFEATWDAYLLLQVEPDIPFTSFYRNRLIGYKFLLATHVVLVFSLLVLIYPSIVVGSALSPIHVGVLLLFLVAIVLRLRSLSLSLHQYRELILSRDDRSEQSNTR